jgi:hypothetical protein
MHPVHTFSPYFPKIYSNIVFPSTPMSSEWSLPFTFSSQNFECISLEGITIGFKHNTPGAEWCRGKAVELYSRGTLFASRMAYGNPDLSLLWFSSGFSYDCQQTVLIYVTTSSFEVLTYSTFMIISYPIGSYTILEVELASLNNTVLNFHFACQDGNFFSSSL